MGEQVSCVLSKDAEYPRSKEGSMDCCSCGCTNIDGPKSGDVCVGIASCAAAAVVVVYGITYCDCWSAHGLDPAVGDCADLDGQSPPDTDTPDRVESGEDVSFGGLLAGDLMTPPFVPPNAERS